MAEKKKKQKQEAQELLRASKFDAIVKECIISPSQEEILQRIPDRDPDSPQLSHATTSYSSATSRDFLTVGAHPTFFYSPEETQNSDAGQDSFDPKFESDRDESLSLNTQCPDIAKSFNLFHPRLQTPTKTKSPSGLPLPEAASANSKPCKTLPEDEALAKPSSCRRRLVGPSEEVKRSPNSPPDLAAAETLIDTPQPISQVNHAQLLDSQDFNQLESQDFQRLDQIKTSDWAGSKLANPDEKGKGQNWIEKTRARRTLPPLFSSTQRKIYSPSCLEMDSSAPTFLEKEISAPTFLDPKRQNKLAAAKHYPETLMDVVMNFSGESPSLPCLERDSSAPTFLEKEISASTTLDPKRQHKVAVAKPSLETLMDVIMHCSGEPPLGYQDADVLEAAIQAGITFPPPLSRYSFCK